jgi:hypothetical protein
LKIAPSRVVLFLAVAFAAFSARGWAQSPGPNVNVINPAPGSFSGDVFERQVETDIVASPVNSGRALAGFITYQTLASGASSWCGYSETTNGGKTWSSNMVPGFPQDTSLQGTSSPLRALGLQQCSDPVLAAAPPNATDPAQVYYGGLGLTQGGLTAAFVVTFQDPDDGSGHFKYIRTVVTDSGNPSFQGQIMDKPSIALDPPSPGFPRGIVHFSWVNFSGASKSTKFQSKVMYSRSTDGGLTFSAPVKLSNTFGQNEGTAMTRTTNGTIYVVWRTFNSENGIQAVTISRNGSISSPTTIAGGTNFFPYDQPTLPDAVSPNFAAFRADAFPTATADRNGRVIVAWQEYVSPLNGQPASSGTGSAPLAIPKIVITSSSNGVLWDSRTAAVPASPPNAVQLQPVLKAGGGLVSLIYYDSSNDTHAQALNFVPEFQQWVYTGSGQGTDTGVDRRMEIWVAQAVLKSDGSAYISQNSFGTPIFGAPVEVSQYATSTGVDSHGNPLPGVQPGQIVPRTQGFADLAINLPNLKTTSSGTVPFIGDYAGLVASVEYLPSGGSWRLALEPGDFQARTFYAVWTDTRTVQFPGWPAPNISGNWGPYNPVGCTNPGTRNTKVFFAPISPGVIARWSGTARPLQLPTGAPVPAQFTVTVENATNANRFFQVTIADNAPSEDWSFVQTPTSPASDPADQNLIDVQILQTSSVTLGLFYRGRVSTNATPSLPLVINIQEVDSFGNPLTAGLTTNLTFTPSGSAIRLLGSTLQQLGVSSQSVNPLPNVPATTSPQPSDTTVQNFGFKNFGFKNFPPTEDVTWSVSGQGLLPTSGNAFVNVANAQDLLNSGAYQFSLFVYVTHSTPTLFGCTAGQLLQDQILSNIPVTSATSTQLVTDFGFKNFGFKNFPPPEISNATFVADSSGVNVALRAYLNPTPPPNAPQFNPTPSNGVVSEADVAQAVNPGATTPSTAFDDTTPPVITFAVTDTGGKPIPPCPPPAPGATCLSSSGFYSGPVLVTPNASDPGSGITSSSGCNAVTVSSSQTVTCSATNGAALFASNSITIKVDATPPVITYVVNGTLGQNGWYISLPTVTWTISAATGIASTSGQCGTTSVGVSGTVTGAFILPETTGTQLTCTATSNAGLTSSVQSIVIKVDTTPPVITGPVVVSGTLGKNGWYVSKSVGLSTTVVENVSTPLTLSSGCTTTSLAGDTVGITVTCTATNNAGLTSAASLTVKIDSTPPVITITAPANNASYLLNAKVASNFGCTDATSLLATCVGTVNNAANINTSTVSANPRTFTVSATDNAGNPASAINSYFVMYNFTLTPLKSPANLGSSVPLFWTLMDANKALISDLTSLVKLTSVFNNGQPKNGPCVASLTGTSPTTLYNPATGATGGSSLRLVSNGIQFNWDSTTAASTGAGCYTVVIQLKDDTGAQSAVLDPLRLHLASVQLK